MRSTQCGWRRCTRGTIPDDAVITKVPRSADVDDVDKFTEVCRSYVHKFHMHGTCVVERCLKGPGGKIVNHYKYDFPLGIENCDQPDENTTRMLYRRGCKEYSKVIPYNLPILFLMGAHVNIQRVTADGWELYLAKYVAKAEPSFDLKLPNMHQIPSDI